MGKSFTNFGEDGCIKPRQQIDMSPVRFRCNFRGRAGGKSAASFRLRRLQARKRCAQLGDFLAGFSEGMTVGSRVFAGYQGIAKIALEEIMLCHLLGYFHLDLGRGAPALLGWAPHQRPLAASIACARSPRLSTAAEKCARWRRKSVPVGLIKKGLEALLIDARCEPRGA
jgi:hypothetical protein